MNIKDKSVEILEKDRCSGCSACFPICPTSAISMEYDEEGFLFPIVNHEKCTNCGLCSKICPELNFDFKNNAKPSCFAMQANDDIRMKSSSGGMFTILSNYVFDKGGFVCGAAFNKNWKVEHIIIDKKEDLDKLRGSKYVQSDKKDIFKNIKELLNKDKYVLFSGCPCEVAGLKNYLRKDYDKLIAVDLLCASTESPKIWEKYLKENFLDKKIKNIKFRDKSSFGWVLSLNVYFENGDYYRGSNSENEYCRFFSSHIMSRKSCLKCSFSSLPRTGDITIADFWNIDRYDKKLDDRKGTSLILLNNSKSDKLFKDIANFNKDIKLLKEIPLYFIKDTCNNGLFTKRNIKIDENRRLNLKNLIKNHTFEKAVKYSFDDFADVGIINFGIIDNNYGSVLTSYAIYNRVEKLGYLPKIIFYPFHNLENGYLSKNFHKNYFKYTKMYLSKKELLALNDYMDAFIVGSDQVFCYNAEYLFDGKTLKKYGIKNTFYLSFANLNKNLIAFAASYGRNEYYGDYQNELTTSYHLSRFDHISVREKDAIDLCKRLFNIDNVEQVIEPVFILDYEEWDKIIADSKLTHKGKLAYYFLDPTEEKEEAVKYIAEKLNIETIDAKDDFKNEVEDFLYIIKNADFVVTDSFHGTCFSTIFKREFISFFNPSRGASRYSLFKEFGLENRIVNEGTDLKNKKDLFEKIDYGETFEIIKKEKERAILWLENALKNKREKKITPMQSMIEYLILENDKLSEKLIQNNYETIDSRYLDLKKEIKENDNWIKLFGIYNTKEYLIFYLFGIKISFKMNEKRINDLAWWIPVRKWRDNFRSKFFNIF